MLGLGRRVGGQQGNGGEKMTRRGVNLLCTEARLSCAAFTMGLFLRAPLLIWARQVKRMGPVWVQALQFVLWLWFAAEREITLQMVKYLTLQTLEKHSYWLYLSTNPTIFLIQVKKATTATRDFTRKQDRIWRLQKLISAFVLQTIYYYLFIQRKEWPLLFPPPAPKKKANQRVGRRGGDKKKKEALLGLLSWFCSWFWIFNSTLSLTYV